ncbi:MAG: helix-turn-helix domain-containing protein [Actinomycetota bacterium]|nr:helix-turn-helix domain-containing protein [Actinomycetota bacterium]
MARPGDEWITATEAARILGLARLTLYKLIDDGELHAEQGARTVVNNARKLTPW